MLAPRSDDPRRSSPAYGVSSHPFGSRRCSAVELPSTAIIVRAAAIPSEYFRFVAILVSIITSRVVMSGRTWTRRPPESRRRTEDRRPWGSGSLRLVAHSVDEFSDAHGGNQTDRSSIVR